MPTDMELVKKGMTVPRAGLLDQAIYHVQLEAKYHAALIAAGWTVANRGELRDAYEFLKTTMAETWDARTVSQTERVNEQSAVGEAKALKRKLVHAFRDLLADQRLESADYNRIYRSGILGRSSKNFIDYFAGIRNTVTRFDTELTPYFGGTSPLVEFDAVLAQLEQTQSTQELNLKALPQETLRVYEAKGRLLSLIEKVNRIGKIAFDGQAPVIGEFNKDLLLRARQKRRTTSAVEPVTDNAMNEDKVSGEENTG